MTFWPMAMRNAPSGDEAVRRVVCVCQREAAKEAKKKEHGRLIFVATFGLNTKQITFAEKTLVYCECVCVFSSFFSSAPHSPLNPPQFSLILHSHSRAPILARHHTHLPLIHIHHIHNHGRMLWQARPQERGLCPRRKQHLLQRIGRAQRPTPRCRGRKSQTDQRSSLFLWRRTHSGQSLKCTTGRAVRLCAGSPEAS